MRAGAMQRAAIMCAVPSALFVTGFSAEAGLKRAVVACSAAAVVARCAALVASCEQCAANWNSDIAASITNEAWATALILLETWMELGNQFHAQ